MTKRFVVVDMEAATRAALYISGEGRHFLGGDFPTSDEEFFEIAKALTDHAIEVEKTPDPADHTWKEV